MLFFSHLVMSNPLQLHGVQHARPPCPSPSLEVCPSLCPLHQWCQPAISSSDALFYFCPQSFPESGAFPTSQLFASDDQNIGASASASVLPVNIQDWSPLIDCFYLLAFQGTFRSLLQHHSSKASILWHSAFITVQLSQQYNWEDLSLDYPDLCCQSNVSCFSTHCLALSSLSCQEAIVFWFHDCSHHLQWFWNPGRGNLSLLPPFPLLMAMQYWGQMPWS